MSIWQDTNGGLHDDMDGTALTMPGWPTGMTKLRAVQAAVLQNPVQTLAQAQFDTCISIDAQAGVARAKYIITVPGQSETYQAKAADAAAYKAAGYPSASIASYPWVQAEAVAINGATPTAIQIQSAADGILGMAAAWVAKGAAIEQARRAGKIAVGAAATVEVAQAAASAAIAALAAL